MQIHNLKLVNTFFGEYIINRFKFLKYTKILRIAINSWKFWQMWLFLSFVPYMYVY